MLFLKDAVRIEQQFVKSNNFTEVFINGSNEYPRVIARGYNRVKGQQPCSHDVKVEARGIFACIVNEQLVSRPGEIKYNKVVFCQRCETVFKAEL